MSGAHPPIVATQPSYTILVAVAFEPTSNAALHEAMRLAQKSGGSELHVVHVVDDSTTTEKLSEAPGRIDKIGDMLRARIETAWQQAGKVKVVAHLRAGDAAEAILHAAIEVNADIIVVGSHRRTVLSKLMLGSIADRVLRESHCPVLIAVPKDYGDDATRGRIEPVCEDCLITRVQSGSTRFWCERHSKPYLHPHVYVPRDENRSSVFETY
jgi:nucleotide-binding universal stress UspA family protein/uncharacterized Zn-finger protein